MNRAADVAIAGVGLVLASPLIGLAALATKLEDRGPVLYRQTRVGKDGVDFDVLKLRTMVVGAEHMGAGYAVDRGDRRITRVGRMMVEFCVPGAQLTSPATTRALSMRTFTAAVGLPLAASCATAGTAQAPPAARTAMHQPAARFIDASIVVVAGVAPEGALSQRAPDRIDCPDRTRQSLSGRFAGSPAGSTSFAQSIRFQPGTGVTVPSRGTKRDGSTRSTFGM